MTDREMLELAAKAAGMTLGKHTQKDCAFTHGGTEWNPITDDGDALRLAVKLWISPMRYESVIFAGVGGSMQPSVEVSYTDDPKKATRLAITRVAAEIGRNMK